MYIEMLERFANFIFLCEKSKFPHRNLKFLYMNYKFLYRNLLFDNRDRAYLYIESGSLYKRSLRASRAARR